MVSNSSVVSGLIIANNWYVSCGLIMVSIVSCIWTNSGFVFVLFVF